MHRLVKEVLRPVLPSDPGMALTSAPEVTVTKGQRKTDSTKRDKLYWEHVSIAHRKIHKSSGYSLGSCLDPVGEADRHVSLGVEVEGIVVDEIGSTMYCLYIHRWIGLEDCRLEYEIYARAYPTGDPIHVKFSGYCN
ncbi:hypothetical protein M9H77_31288 [Catharanthus roseus]|uniref:Uncharacterized protein n=1 Tax=Catharanthus roseus TaxID=4058 RepID=A0ACC0A020_CATRO|nr:hypothetical protein M9H77_31288 [Catharanthus roseus]